MISEAHIPAFTLDTLLGALGLERVDLVKIDVKGAEEKVLEGAAKLLDAFRPALLIEAHGKESWSPCRRILENHSYEYDVINRNPIASALYFHVYAHTEVE